MLLLVDDARDMALRDVGNFVGQDAGEKVEVRLADAVNGRVSRQNIVNPITDEVIVRENELITKSPLSKDWMKSPGRSLLSLMGGPGAPTMSSP